MPSLDSVRELLAYLTPEEQAEMDNLIAADIGAVPWRPLPGPQTLAAASTADVIGFGGAAGGGKTDLACGKAVCGAHEKIAIFRREGTELTAIVDRLTELFGGRDGYNGKDKIWRRPMRQIELCSVPHLGDEKAYQGRPKDLLVLDEAANFLEAQVRFLMGWVRSTTPGQRCQTLMTFNPPTSAEGRWIVKFFAPWLDRKFAGKRAMPGELRHVGMVPGENGVSRDVWVDDGRPFVVEGGKVEYDFDPKAYAPEMIITPQTRTFIPSRVSDNPYLANTGYLAQLQSMPEPLRSQMLFGDFEAGMEDSVWQVIPTAWVEAAMLRWTRKSQPGAMDSMGVDVARGGKDMTVLSARHGTWYAPLVAVPGTQTPSGRHVVGQVVAHVRDDAPVHVDVIGVGSSPYDMLREGHYQTVGVNVGVKSLWHGKSGKLLFKNLRSELWWRFREALDPENSTTIELPPDPELLADLCAPEWWMDGKEIRVESREEIFARIARSPDRASAVLLAQLDTPKLRHVGGTRSDATRQAVLEYDPYAGLGA
jgi:hypothetical protein